MSAPGAARLGLGRLLAWAGGYALRFPGAIGATLALMGGGIVLNLLKPWPLVFLIDHVLRRQPMPDWLGAGVAMLPGDGAGALIGWAVGATILIFLLDWTARLALAFFGITLGQRITFAIAADLFRHLQRLSLRFHARRPTGDTIRRVTADCTSATTVLRDALLPLLEAVGSLALMFFVMWRISPALTLVAISAVPVMMVIFRAYSGEMLDRAYVNSEAEGEVYATVERSFAAMPAVAAFQLEERNRRLFRRAAASVVDSAIALLAVQLKFTGLMGLTIAVGTAAIFWLGGHAAAAGEVSVGTIVLFLSYLSLLYAPLQTILQSGSTIQSAGGSARRVLELFAVMPDVADRPGAAPLGVRGDVELRDVSFGYDADRTVLERISLTVAAGSTVALVGPTGAGKSTLVGLIPRFFDPVAGQVLIDGVDARDVALASLRDQVSVVLQESFLFPVSIAENIAYGRPEAGQEAIEAAARAAQAHDFIMRLPDGYATVVGERGATLSGGERQRIAIARALLKDAPILILDEPTSALDAATEATMMAAVGELIRGRTTFVIAHRLATAKRADRIVVLDRGRIVEAGRHDELIARSGLYARLSALQLAA